MKKTMCALLALSLAGCASYQPVVDTKGVDMNVYQVDLKECQAYAEQVNVGGQATAGAGAGALMGALLGAAIGGRGAAGYGAKIGAAEGVGIGAAHGASSQVQVIQKCMVGRGYKVLA
jgi:hypothetical protein